jgi:hypothetical protein
MKTIAKAQQRSAGGSLVVAQQKSNFTGQVIVTGNLVMGKKETVSS